MRPIYVRRGEGDFIILAIGPEAVVDPSGFKAAVTRATSRALSDLGIEV